VSTAGKGHWVQRDTPTNRCVVARKDTHRFVYVTSHITLQNHTTLLHLGLSDLHRMYLGVTACSTVLEKMTVAQPVNNFPSFAKNVRTARKEHYVLLRAGCFIAVIPQALNYVDRTPAASFYVGSSVHCAGVYYFYPVSLAYS
jgi:hypothetical protein